MRKHAWTRKPISEMTPEEIALKSIGNLMGKLYRKQGIPQPVLLSVMCETVVALCIITDDPDVVEQAIKGIRHMAKKYASEHGVRFAAQGIETDQHFRNQVDGTFVE